MAGTGGCSGMSGVFTRIIAWFNILVHLEILLIFLGGCVLYLFEPTVLLQEITSMPFFRGFTNHTIKRIIMAGMLYCLLNAAMGYVLLTGANLRKTRLLSGWVVYSMLLWCLKFMVLFVKSKDITFPLWLWVILVVTTIFEWASIAIVQKHAKRVRDYDDIDEKWEYTSDTSSKLSVIVY